MLGHQRPQRSVQSPQSVQSLMIALILGFSSVGYGQMRSPTPDQRLDRVLAPITTAREELHLTAAELGTLTDLNSRAEALAAEQVESVQRGQTSRANAADRAIVALARVLRGRIEALRAESSAVELEQRAADQRQAARLARAALERATERRVLAEQLSQRAEQTLINNRASAAATQTARSAEHAGAGPK